MGVEAPEEVTSPVYAMLDQYLTCAHAAVGEVGRAFVATGQPAWDDCCEGQVWVRLVQVETVQVGKRLASGHMCTQMKALTVGVGVLRCALVIDDQGHAPEASALSKESLGVLVDMDALSNAIQCCEVPGAVRVTMSRWDALGPEGGCVGGEWQAVIWQDMCSCSSASYSGPHRPR